MSGLQATIEIYCQTYQEIISSLLYLFSKTIWPNLCCPEMQLEILKTLWAANWKVITKLTCESDEALVSIEHVGDKVSHFNIIYEQSLNKFNVMQKGNDEVLTVCSVEHI